MYFTLLVVVILTAIALVAVALGIARAISPALVQPAERRGVRVRYPDARTVVDAVQGGVLPVRDPVPDVRRRTVFLFAWAVVVQEIGVFGLVSALFFLLILTFGLAYAWRKGALEWK